MKTISVITPVYNEQDNVENCVRTLARIFSEQLPGYKLEHILADNASTDDTPNILRKLAGEFSHIKVIFNSRNYGALKSNHNAMLAASGDAVIVFLPADLQDPPELIPEFVRLWDQEGYEVVYGVRAQREEGKILSSLRKLFYKIVTAWTPFDVPMNAGEFQLIDKKVLEALRGFKDAYPYLRGMIAYCGFKRIGVPYKWRARAFGLSKATSYGYVDQAINGIISFNNMPLRICLFFGLGLSVLSFAFGFISLIMALLGIGSPPDGIRTLIIALFFFAGVLLFVLGVISEYIYAIYANTRWRPPVIERERVNF